MLFTGLRENDLKKIEGILTAKNIPFKTGINPEMVGDGPNKNYQRSTSTHHEYFLLDVELHDLEKLTTHEIETLNRCGVHFQLDEPDFNLHPDEELKIQNKVAKKPNRFFQFLMIFISCIWILMMFKNM